MMEGEEEAHVAANEYQPDHIEVPERAVPGAMEGQAANGTYEATRMLIRHF